jgi:NitT/TauT family transport system substrate-binding protein
MARAWFRSLVVAISLFGAVAARADDLTLWRNGTVSPTGDAGMLFMAAKGGFGPAFGLDLQMVTLRGDPLLLKALIADQIESYIGGPPSPLIAASKGAPIRIVGCNWNKQLYTFWARSSIHGLADLKGRTIGISTPGSAPDIFMRAALAGAGVAPTSVQFVAAGDPAQMIQSAATGVVDATATPADYAARAEKLGLHALTTSEQATPLSMQRCYYVGTDMLQHHADRVAHFLAAEIAAYTYSLSHRTETIALARTVLHAPDDAPEPVISYDNVVSHGVIDMSFNPPMEKLRWLRDILVQSGQVKPGFDPASIIDLGPLEQARKLAAAAGTSPASKAAVVLSQAKP